MITYNELDNVLPVLNMRIAGELMVKGFVLKHTTPDSNGSNRNVFIFKNSPEIVEAFNKILASRK